MNATESQRNDQLAPRAVRRPSSLSLSQLSRSSDSGSVLNLPPGSLAESTDDERFPPSPTTVARRAIIKYERDLTSWDAAALIINKMVGTGIFVAPPTVLLNTGSKRVALGLWSAGFVHTLLSMLIYLEYSRKLPYNGGELVYLDQVLQRPTLLVYTCYSIYFVCFYTTATNSMQFAYQVIIASTNSTDLPDQRVLRFIAVAITTLICLLLYFSTHTGRKINTYLCSYKLGLLITIFIAAAVKAGKEGLSNSDIDQNFDKSRISSVTALLSVLFSFQGWENATYVAGEIKVHKTLRKGFLGGVLIVGIFYMLINIVYCYAIPWGPNGAVELQYVPILFGDSQRARHAWAVLAAISAAGNVLSVSYTCVQVKQTIAWANVLPWSTFWRSEAPVRPKGPEDEFELQNLIPGRHVPRVWIGTPQGGIILHWIACVFYICLSSTISSYSKNISISEKKSMLSEAVTFSGLLNTYGHSCAGFVIGASFPLVSKLEYNLPKDRGWEPGPTPWWFSSVFSHFLLGWLHASASVVVMALAAIGPYRNTSGNERVVKGWYYPVITFSLFFFSVLYYLLFLASGNASAVWLAGVRLTRKKHGVDDNSDLTRQCKSCKNYERGQEHRHDIAGYRYYNELHFPDPDHGRNILYWLFGGRKEQHIFTQPIDSLLRNAEGAIGNIKGWFNIGQGDA